MSGQDLPPTQPSVQCTPGVSFFFPEESSASALMCNIIFDGILTGILCSLHGKDEKCSNEGTTWGRPSCRWDDNIKADRK